MKTTKKLTGRDSVVSSCLMRLEWVGISVRGNAPIRITLIHHRNGSVSDCVGFYLACGGPPSPQGGRPFSCVQPQIFCPLQTLAVSVRNGQILCDERFPFVAAAVIVIKGDALSVRIEDLVIPAVG